MRPLVSVVLPCFNCAETLPWALASLISQTFVNWECIVIDDGSTDNSSKIIQTVDDSRFRLIRFSSNRGRPFARQAGLDAAKGHFLAMLDADDWLYPEKLARQIEIFEKFNWIEAVSAGMMIVDDQNFSHGVRTFPNKNEEEFAEVFIDRLKPLPFAHGPTMLKMGSAKKFYYDARLIRGEDSDFLAKILKGKRCALIYDPLYSYCAHEQASFAKFIIGLNCDYLRFKTYFAQGEAGARTECCKSVFKIVFYSFLNYFGLFDRLVQNRDRTPSKEEIRGYFQAKIEVNYSFKRLMQR